MKIDFEHLGGIDKGSIKLNDFTLFCGKNNSGKTYAMYTLYGLLSRKFQINFGFVKDIVDQLQKKGDYQITIAEIISLHQAEMISEIEKGIKEYLPKLFGVNNKDFSKTNIHISFCADRQQFSINGKSVLGKQNIEFERDSTLDITAFSDSLLFKITRKSTITDSINTDLWLQRYISQCLVDFILVELCIEDSFLLPAERAGLNLFFKELFSVRNYLLQHAQSDNINPLEVLKDIIESRYPAPIQDYLQFLSKIGLTREDKSDSYLQFAEEIQTKVLGGRYEVDEFGNVFFIPVKTKNKLPLHFSSSTVKSLFGLVFYLEHVAEIGDYLMIDEPELNLHPDNQRQLARILTQLVNAGLKVVVSTHSDYFVRELNNLIMLKTGFDGASDLKAEYDYQDKELLDSSKVSAYLFDNKSIRPMKIDIEEGIIATTFDEVINSLNNSSNEIYYTMQDAKFQDK